ncbi:MAG: hypothetical protein HIU81_11480 [Acidobacteria bacterium]|nr:hypothetical protein [Acidobacteriota bacterium]
MALTSAEVRRYTTRAGLSRTEGGTMALISEVYNTVFAALVLVVMAGAIVINLRASMGSGSISLNGSALTASHPGISALDAGATLMLTLAAALMSVEASVGPVIMTRPQTVWWLGLPLDRRGFIQPGFLRSMVWPLAGAVLVTVPLALGAVDPTAFGSSGGSVGSVAAAVGTSIGLALCIYGVATLAQIRGKSSLVRSVAGTAMIAAPLLLAADALLAASGTKIPWTWPLYLPTGWPLLAASGAVWPLLVALLGIAALWLAFRQLPALTTNALKDSAATGSHVAGSVLSMDSTELSRALSSADGSHSRAGKSLLPRRGMSPAAALLRSQLILILRNRSGLARAVVLATVPGIVASVQALSAPGLVAVVILFCAYFAASALASVAKQSAGNPSLNSLLPLDEKLVHRLHWVWPAAGMTLWMALMSILMVILAGGSWLLVPLAICAGPGVAAAAIRAAYRPAPDWTMPAISSAMGPIPTGAIRGLIAGPDAALIALLPLGICMLAGGVPNIAFPLALILSTLMYLWGCRVRKRPGA